MFSRIKVSTCSQIISKSRLITQSCPQNRSLHILLRTNDVRSKINYLGCFSSSVLNTNSIRFSSNTTALPLETALPPIPDAPTPITPEIVGAVGEETLESLGLGSYYWPTGWIQHCLYFLHTSCGLPWWTTIIAGTALLKIAILPVFIKVQRHQELSKFYKKDLSYYDRKRKEASDDGDSFSAQKYFLRMEQFYKDHNMLTMKKIVINMGLQGFAFCTFFMSLRGMAIAPVSSFREGGFWWFTDLTQSDSYYVLPLVSAACAGLYIYFSPAVSLGGTANLQGFKKYIPYIFPILSVPFMIFFKNAVLLYIITQTWMTLLFKSLLKVPKIRSICKIPKIVDNGPQEVVKKSEESVFSSIKSSWQSMRKNRSQNSLVEADERQFTKAGRGPLIKTYKSDPTKVMASRRN